MRLKGIVDATQNRKASNSDVVFCQALWDQIDAANEGQDSGQEKWRSGNGYAVLGHVVPADDLKTVSEEFLNTLRLRSHIFSGWRLSNLLEREAAPSWMDRLEDVFGTGDGTDWSITAFNQYTRDLPSEMICSAPLVCGEIGYRVGPYCVNRDVVSYQERIHAMNAHGVFSRLPERPTIVEIGGGYGALAYFIQQAIPTCNYYIVDLPGSLKFSSAYLIMAVGSSQVGILGHGKLRRFTLVPTTKVGEIDLRIDLAINTLSFAEMNEGIVDGYAKMMRRMFAPDGCLFEQNRPQQDLDREFFCDPETVLARTFSGPETIQYPWGKANLWGLPVLTEKLHRAVP